MKGSRAVDFFFGDKKAHCHRAASCVYWDSGTDRQQERPCAMRSSSRTPAMAEVGVKVKRKCGRPRNPIPRHKRVSHINAEHRRRGKIQNGFQTLKNMVPKYESSGRDSKADILFKAVDHSRKLQKECREQERQLKELRAQRKALNADIERHQTSLPEGQLFEEQPLTPAQRLDELINSRASDNWCYWIFGFFMKPLHTTFQETVSCETTETFVTSVLEWAKQNMSTASLRSVALESLRTISTKTSIMTKPEMLQSEAHQQCAPNMRPITNTPSCSLHLSLPHTIKQERSEPLLHDITVRKSRSRQGRPQLNLDEELKIVKDIKPESIEQQCSMAADFCLRGGFETPSNYESASPIDLSPPGSSQYDSASVFSDLQDWDCSSVDQGYDTPSVDSPGYMQHVSPSPLTDQYPSPSPDLLEVTYRSGTNTSPSFPLPCPVSLPPVPGGEDQQGGLDETDFLQHMDLDPADCSLLLDPADRHLLFTQSERHLLDTAADLDQPFDFSVLDYDTGDISIALPCYTSL